MRVLITGNMGYVGPVVVEHIREQMPGSEIIGYDSAFFGHSLTTRSSFPERFLSRQIFGDIRDIGVEELRGIDAVVHLAAVSNDPMGNRFEAVTEAINERASIALAETAAAAGVKNFVFASSCSVYGFAEDGRARRESDDLNPLTAYARSKIGTETGLKSASLQNMTTTSLRFATACGFSDRLRLDLVLNDFVACAISSQEITVLSDGSPWRPLINTTDMARAVEWAIHRTADNGGIYLAVNVGTDSWNYQVKDLAHAAAKAFPGTVVSLNANAQPDKRSYRVDFSLYRQLAPLHQPVETLESSVAGLHRGLVALGFSDPEFRSSPLVRLKVLESHIAAGRLSEDLRWRKHCNKDVK